MPRRLDTFRFILVAAAAAAPTSLASAQCDPHWEPTFGEAPGVSDNIEAMVTFDDGSGEALYVAGDFTRAGGISASRIAKWDGERWSALDEGMDIQTVHSLAVWDDGSGAGPALYAGGSFSMAGGQPGTSAIAKWDGDSWSPVGGGIIGFVWSMKVWDDGTGPALYVGGFFDDVGTTEVPANRIAKWDGTTWSALGSGMASGPGGQVRALEVFDDGTGEALYAAGSFLEAGGVTVNRIARWNGSAWSPVGNGSGFDWHVWDPQVWNDGTGPALYAAGEFQNVDGVPASRLAKWNGTSWSPVGTGVAGTTNVAVRSLLPFNDGIGEALYIAGNFTSAGGVEARSFAKWDGTNFSALGVGMNGLVTSLAVYDDGTGPAIFAGGSYIGLGLGLIVDRILKWDGTNFHSLGGSFNNAVRDLAVWDDGSGPALYACGNFISADAEPLLRVAKWNGGTSWTGLGGGVTSGTEVQVLEVYDDAQGAGPLLYAGGNFRTIGGQSIDRIAKWDGAAWSPVGNTGGASSTVYAMTVWEDGIGTHPALYVGGQFTSIGGISASRVARWDGVSWSPLDVGVNNTVTALAVWDDGFGPALYVAGGFTEAGGAFASRVAKWDGEAWYPLGFGMSSGLVSALTVYDDGAGSSLYAGGGFSMVDGLPITNIARWDGTFWDDVGGGVNGTGINTMHVFDDGSGPALYVGGEFTMAGATLAARIARWNGTEWSALSQPGTGEEGVNGHVGALTVFDDASGLGSALYIGGGFDRSPGGDSKIARWVGCPATTCACEFDGDVAQVNVFDLLAYLDFWFAQDAAADIDAAPGVDVFDLLFYLNCWFPASAGNACP